ncbi:Hypothetical protein NGAL_HAMBI1189_38320 [Neorhizobium galegae bv. officinalis]|uniref:Uncharacterized protein n=1 Tax=Neorhizobium galegae bv. officinalis TaxID=323656 RepID=A0A0T7GVL5_NEOGA|nr:Hypothetical protein NGAL_HAMBI1189_38320 [Neorhizobium galegae bv. officinalis]
MISATGSHGLCLVGWQLCAVLSVIEIVAVPAQKQTFASAAASSPLCAESGRVHHWPQARLLRLSPHEYPASAFAMCRRTGRAVPTSPISRLRPQREIEGDTVARPVSTFSALQNLFSSCSSHDIVANQWNVAPARNGIRQSLSKRDSVTQTEVHPLPTCRTMHMSSIAHQQHPVLVKAIRKPVMNLETGTPQDVRHASSTWDQDP